MFLCISFLSFFIGCKEEPAPKQRTAADELRMQPVIEEDVYICTGSQRGSTTNGKAVEV